MTRSLFFAQAIPHKNVVFCSFERASKIASICLGQSSDFPVFLYSATAGGVHCLRAGLKESIFDERGESVVFGRAPLLIGVETSFRRGPNPTSP